MTTKAKAPEKELDKLEKQFDAFDQEVKSLTMDRMNEAPKQEVEAQTKLSSREIDKSKEIYLKPIKTVGCREKFNENFRAAWEYDKEYVRVIAENRELIGETIELWSKPYAGVNAEFWNIPTNKPIYIPRYVAEQLKRKYYHRLTMQEGVATEQTHAGTMVGKMIVDSTIQRLDCFVAPTVKNVSMTKRHF